jgi:hypothetical protein
MVVANPSHEIWLCEVLHTNTSLYIQIRPVCTWAFTLYTRFILLLSSSGSGSGDPESVMKSLVQRPHQNLNHEKLRAGGYWDNECNPHSKSLSWNSLKRSPVGLAIVVYTHCTFGAFSAKSNVYIYCIYMDLANPTHLWCFVPHSLEPWSLPSRPRWPGSVWVVHDCASCMCMIV